MRILVLAFIGLSSASQASAADYYPMAVGLTWITREYGRVDTTWISRKEVEASGREIFWFQRKPKRPLVKDSTYAYRVGKVVYVGSIEPEGRVESDKIRSDFQDGMTYKTTLVNVDTKDTILTLQVTARLVRHVETPFAILDSCFLVEMADGSSSPMAPQTYGPNVGLVKLLGYDGLPRTELLHFGHGVPVVIGRSSLSKPHEGTEAVDVLGRRSGAEGNPVFRIFNLDFPGYPE